MPELPEVETVRRDLAEVITGQQITAVQVFDTKLSMFKKVAQKIVGKTCAQPQRRGKFLLLPFTDFGHILVIHLRMTGQMIYRNKLSASQKQAASRKPPVVVVFPLLPEKTGLDESDKYIFFASGHPAKIDLYNLPDKHTRFQITFDDGGELFFNDQRRFGTAELLAPAAVEAILQPFGVEPGLPEWTLDYFTGLTNNRKTSIKALLLNQNLIFGLGNIYADEVCFRSGVLPTRLAGELTKAEQKKIFANCDSILKEAIECRGTSIRDFVDGSGKPGGFAEKLQVYQRQGQDCFVCGTPISKIKCAGRGTHYCSKCQK